MELREQARAAFLTPMPADKVSATLTLQDLLESGQINISKKFDSVEPGRPQQPVLVEPKEVPRRSPFTPTGHAALIHSIAHIEFNAIDLALDCVWRFHGMPEAFYLDWTKVAIEEAKHFQMLEDHLRTQGHRYGDFPAHTGLWTMCENTAEDIIARMALVPRTLEARGLDATPLIQAKLTKVGTAAALEAHGLLAIILREEVGHVATGNRWFHWLCERHRLDASAFYAKAALEHAAPKPKPPFNYAARRAAGFSQEDIEALNRGAGLCLPTGTST